MPLHRGVYAVGHARLRREGHWLAAVLAVGPRAVLSHRSAAALHDVRPTAGAQVDVATPRAGVTGQPGVQVHHTALRRGDVTVLAGIPVTTIARTLVDLAQVLPADHLRKALDTAAQLGRLDMRALADAQRRTRGRHGRGPAILAVALAELDALGTTLTRSELEERFQRLLADHRLPPPQTNVLIDGMEVDAVWPQASLAVELDGWHYHRSQRAFQRDRARANALTAAGYRVVRFTHDDVARRPAGVAELLRRLLAAG